MFPRVFLCLVLAATQVLRVSGGRRGRLPRRPVRAPILTPGASPWHLLPTWESSLTVFGVQAEGDAHIKFASEAQNLHVVVSLNATEHGSETQMTVSTGDMAVTLVSRHNVSLSADRYTWFAVFRKESVFAVTRDGSVTPLLLYSNDSAGLDFFTCNVFQVWSRGNATWDFRGEKYLGVTPGTVPRDPAVVAEVRGAVRGLAERIMAIDFFLDHVRVPFLPRPAHEHLTEILDDLNPFFLLFRFHGYDFFRFLKIVPSDNIMRARNVLSSIHAMNGKSH